MKGNTPKIVDCKKSALPRPGMAAAIQRGMVAREALKAEEGGSVSAEEVRKFLGGITRTAVLNQYKRGALLGWRNGQRGGLRFPIWQFASNGLLPGLGEALAILASSRSVDDWAAILFFLSKRASLNNQRPLDALRRGDVDAAKRAAYGYVE